MKTERTIMLCMALFAVGCATVKVQAPKEPIKVDIAMRLDVYQHVQSDINAIENIVTGTSQQAKTPGPQSMLDYFIGTAYAQGLDPEVEAAALRRKTRLTELTSLEASGVIGEDNSGFVVVRTGPDTNAQRITREENADRMIIYKEIAEKNGISVNEVRKLYAERLQESAPAGTPIESSNGTWRIK